MGCRAGKPDQDAAAAEERLSGPRRARGPRRRGRGGAGREEALPTEVDGDPSHSSAAPSAHPQTHPQQQQQQQDGPGASTEHSTYTNPVFADDSGAAAAPPSPEVDANATGLLLLWVSDDILRMDGRSLLSHKQRNSLPSLEKP